MNQSKKNLNMKIVYDYKIFNQPYGGVSRYYKTLAYELLKAGQDVKILPGLHINNYLGELPKNIIKGFKLKSYPKKSAALFNGINHLFNEFEMRLDRPDLIHETYYSSLPHFKSNSIRVTTVYDMIHELYGCDFSNNDKTKIIKKAVISRVDHILCISESTKNDLINILGVDEEKISVVHLGVDVDAFRYKMKSKITKPFLLYVGNRSGYKNFNIFIKAFASCNKLKSEFNIIAFGGGQLSLSESQLIKKNGLLENQVIQISGGDDKLIELYQQATAFIYPSKYEGFGLPPLEAMASNCPVISSNTSSMPEVVNQAGEYFDPLNIESIRDAIKKVVFSEERTKELIKLGNENLKNFSWEKCANETINVYKKLL